MRGSFCCLVLWLVASQLVSISMERSVEHLAFRQSTCEIGWDQPFDSETQEGVWQLTHIDTYCELKIGTTRGRWRENCICCIFEESHDVASLPWGSTHAVGRGHSEVPGQPRQRSQDFVDCRFPRHYQIISWSCQITTEDCQSVAENSIRSQLRANSVLSFHIVAVVGSLWTVFTIWRSWILDVFWFILVPWAIFCAQVWQGWEVEPLPIGHFGWRCDAGSGEDLTSAFIIYHRLSCRSNSTHFSMFCTAACWRMTWMYKVSSVDMFVVTVGEKRQNMLGHLHKAPRSRPCFFTSMRCRIPCGASAACRLRSQEKQWFPQVNDFQNDFQCFGQYVDQTVTPSLGKQRFQCYTAIPVRDITLLKHCDQLCTCVVLFWYCFGLFGTVECARHSIRRPILHLQWSWSTRLPCSSQETR